MFERSLVILWILSMLVASVDARQEPEVSLVTYFEIPVSDMSRARAFYQIIFDVKLTSNAVDGVEMAMFPDAKKGAITGALAKGESYVPGLQGTRVYFNARDINALLEKVVNAGGSVNYPKTDIGEWGYVAEFVDSKGNIIALHQPKKVDQPKG